MECDDRELNEVEKLMDIMTREYNAFVVQSAAVADLVKKVRRIDCLRGRWILSRRSLLRFGIRKLNKGERI